ncbi:MAG: helix-turn-helix transcriptional regulator [Lachnospiraceae bacterium]|nr:helix-turn-helix transcriptional regulator [Lachnospiraceae bacterium]
MKLETKIKLKYHSLAQFSKITSIPYSTLHDLCSGRKELMDCTGRTLYKLASGLNMSIDELIKGESFQSFRDNLHHQNKQWGSLNFLVHYLEHEDVIELWHSGQSVRALYLLAMLDTICDRQGLPLAKEYAQLRENSLSEPMYIGDSILDKEMARERALPRFLKFNIYEGSIDDAV